MKKIYIASTLIIALGVGVGGGILARKSATRSAATPATTSTHDRMSMSDSSLKGLTGDAYGKMFITMMSEHHAGAVAMAQYAQQSSKPEVKQLADNIITAQTKELADMKNWSAKWGYTYVEPSQHAINNMTAGVADKTGEELDKQFLSDMIGHHQDALDMARYSRKNAKHQEIVDLSSNVETTQSAEIAFMKSLQSKYGYSVSSGSSMSGMRM